MYESYAETTILSLVSNQSNTYQQYYNQHMEQHDDLQHQQQLQTQEFISNSSLCSEDNDHGELMSNASHRKAKRAIPEVEKDDKYWDKRKRNNMAAKRSRENKRTIEHSIRHKATYLEEENAVLRKEISLIKNRFGLPLDESIMTPEEHELCKLEVRSSAEAAERKRGKDSGTDDVSSTSPNVSQINSQENLDESVGNQLDNSDNSDSSPTVKEEARSNSTYGPSIYGPFNPSPSWAPVGPVGIPSLYANYPVANYSQMAGQSNLSPAAKAVQDKRDLDYSCYINRGRSNFMQSPYNYYMQFAGHGNQGLYGSYTDGAKSDIAPADLSMNRNKGHKEQIELSGRSVGGGGSGSEVSSSGVMNMRNNKVGGLPSGVSRSPLNSEEQGMCKRNVSVKESSSGRIQNSQNQFSRGLKLPAKSNTRFSHGHSAAQSARNNDDALFKHPDKDYLRRENETLKKTIQTLTAQVELMKDQVFTN